MAGVNNFFVSIHRKFEGSLTPVVFLAAILMTLIGINLFIEDTVTSYYGVQAYQEHFGLVLAIYPITYWSESLVPQIGQILFFYAFFTDMKRNWWAALIAVGLLIVDFYADLYHRTQGTLTLSTLADERTIAGAAITLFFFTIGAELFITMGFGLAMTTMAPAIKTVKRMYGDIRFSLGSPQSARNVGSSGRSSVDPSRILGERD